MNFGDSTGKKKYALFGVSAVLLVAAVLAVTVMVTRKPNETNKSKEISSSVKSIEAICQPTDYKEECIKSLESSSGKTDDPKELIRTSFKVTVKYINEAAKKSITLKQVEKDPRTAQALGTCKELANYAVRQLKQSFDRLGDFDVAQIDEMLLDLKTWLTSSMTYQETCLEGFQNTTGDAGEKMRAALQTSMHLTSNGLAMVTEISAALTGIPTSNGRRLLSEDFKVLGHDKFDIMPDWVNPMGRRLLYVSGSNVKPNVVIALDGTGQFKTIHEALKLVPVGNKKPFVIYIKEGVYKEYVRVQVGVDHVVFIGDGPKKTRITGKNNYVDGLATYKTATVAIFGNSFMAMNIGFENTSGPKKHQAVALLVQSDNSVFYNCAMDGYQDTLYVHTNRQFYRDCTISGTIDFVFGNAAAIFQNCKFLIRKPLKNQQTIVTAHGRTERRQASALVLQNCTITSDPEFYLVRKNFKSFLGRPWNQYSRTIIMESFIDDVIEPEGWMSWIGNAGLNTCFYAEVNNRGPGSDKTKRVTWRGIRNITAKHAVKFTAGRFVFGDLWIKPTGVPYTSGMITAATA